MLEFQILQVMCFLLQNFTYFNALRLFKINGFCRFLHTTFVGQFNTERIIEITEKHDTIFFFY